MGLELTQLAAGLPMALSLAVAGGIATLREGRRRSALNEAMHELRRPLQTLSLALPADSARTGALDSSLRMAAAAVERLDREINGTAVPHTRGRVELAPLLRVAAERWRTRAVHHGRSLQLRLESRKTVVHGDGIALAQAVDNLISNAIDHGAGEVTVTLTKDGDTVRLAVADEGRIGAEDAANRPSLRARLGGRCRRGHGLRVVQRVARSHGGTFRLRRSCSGTEARLELPLQPPGASA